MPNYFYTVFSPFYYPARTASSLTTHNEVTVDLLHPVKVMKLNKTHLFAVG